MDKFTEHTGIGLPLRRTNVDTDQPNPVILRAAPAEPVILRAAPAASQNPESQPGTSDQVPGNEEG